MQLRVFQMEFLVGMLQYCLSREIEGESQVDGAYVFRVDNYSHSLEGMLPIHPFEGEQQRGDKYLTSSFISSIRAFGAT